MLIICILILIVYLVTSNEGFEMRQLTNKEDMQSDFDFISIYNLIAVNLSQFKYINTTRKNKHMKLLWEILKKTTRWIWIRYSIYRQSTCESNNNNSHHHNSRSHYSHWRTIQWSFYIYFQSTTPRLYWSSRR